MIRTEELTKKFDDFTAVNQLNLSIPSGQIMALLGPNGAGKTTTVRMLSSILKPSAGKAEIAGFDVVEQSVEVRRKVGVLTEHHGLYGRMKAEEYLIFFGELYGFSKNEIIKKINPLLEQLGMDEHRKKRLGEYSKGMRQKLALVRALIHEPPVLLLDEPTSAMDPESAKIVRTAIKNLSSNDRTIILCTHNLSEAEELCDQIVIIQHGNIILNDSLKEIKNSLLGATIYAAEFNQMVSLPLNGLPPGVKVLNFEENKVQFAISDPQTQNPILLRKLTENFDLISFQEIPIKLEDAYLNAINNGKLTNEND